jgi:hypothetical protein
MIKELKKRTIQKIEYLFTKGIIDESKICWKFLRVMGNEVIGHL